MHCNLSLDTGSVGGSWLGPKAAQLKLGKLAGCLSYGTRYEKRRKAATKWLRRKSLF